MKRKAWTSKVLLSFLPFLILFNVCGISVNASESADLSINEPFTSDYSGYFAFSRDDGRIYLYYWTLTDVCLDVDSINTIDFQNLYFTFTTNQGSLTPNIGLTVSEDFKSIDLDVLFSNSLSTGYFNLFRYTSYTDTWDLIDSFAFSDLNNHYNRSLAFNNYTLTSFCFDGLVSFVDTQGLQSLRLTFSDQISNSDVNNIKNTLTDIYNSLNPDSSDTEDTSYVDSTQITNISSKEEELLSENLSDDLGNMEISINPNSSSVCWGIIDDVLTSNSKVFSMFLSILAIGIIGLILNR